MQDIWEGQKKTNPPRIKWLWVIFARYPCRRVRAGTGTNLICFAARPVFIPWNQLELVSILPCFFNSAVLSRSFGEAFVPTPAVTVWLRKKMHCVFQQKLCMCLAVSWGCAVSKHLYSVVNKVKKKPRNGPRWVGSTNIAENYPKRSHQGWRKMMRKQRSWAVRWREWQWMKGRKIQYIL